MTHTHPSLRPGCLWVPAGMARTHLSLQPGCPWVATGPGQGEALHLSALQFLAFVFLLALIMRRLSNPVYIHLSLQPFRLETFVPAMCNSILPGAQGPLTPLGWGTG